MPKPTTDAATFTELYRSLGAAATAKRLGVGERSVHARRARLEQELGERIVGPTAGRQSGARLEIPFTDGNVLIGSDAHYWPGPPSPAHRAFVKFNDLYQPPLVIQNGDVLDAATISRYPPIGWERMPSVKEELDVCKERLAEIRAANPGARYVWTLGNHDARFETRLAMVAPEFAEVHGVHLKDHFPEWEPCWSAFVGGEGGLVVKHRFKGGTHATHNNVLWAGRSIATGHLHALGVRPFSDYNGLRFGIDTGTLSDPYGPQFEGYTEDNPVNWRQGFVWLTFHKGSLLWPEVVYVIDEDHVAFRGEVIKV